MIAFDNIYQLPLIFSIIGLIDITMYRHYDKLKLDRWFFLHVLANLSVATMALPDLINLVMYPVYLSSEVTSWPKNITFCLHMYHIIAFRNLKQIDWAHHLIMCVCLLFISNHRGGEITNFIMFFINGFPGALDYIMLLGVKRGILDPMTEKCINNHINAWIRAPGILIGTVLIYVHWHLGNLDCSGWSLFYVLAALYWNAQYFNNRVAINYGIKSVNSRSEPILSHH